MGWSKCDTGGNGHFPNKYVPFVYFLRLFFVVFVCLLFLFVCMFFLLIFIFTAFFACFLACFYVCKMFWICWFGYWFNSCVFFFIIQLLESPIPTTTTTPATLSQKASSGDISGTKRGIIDLLMSKRPEKIWIRK